MDLRKHKFPRWAAPLLGIPVGIVAAFGLRKRPWLAERQVPTDILYVLAFAGVGALAGCVVYLIDIPTTEGRPATTSGSILAVLSIFPGFCPFVGLLLGVPAFLVNRKVSGWQNLTSRIGLALSIVLTIIIVVASQVPLR